MAGCDIAIQFDRDGAYRGGEVVRGEVVVRATDDVDCNGLVLHRYWRTAGKGSTDTGPRVTATLFRGRWEGGAEYRYPFHFTAPAAPLTYRGKTMRIDHYVEARADVPWAFDPKAREPFYLEPGGEGGPMELGSTKAAPPDVDLNQLTKGSGPMVAGIICIIVGIFTVLLAWLLVPVGIILIVWSAFVMNARKKIGEVDAKVPSTVSPGATLPVRLSFTPTAEAVINNITATLVGVERCTSGSGKNKKTHRATIHSERYILSAGGSTTPGQPVTVEGAVPLPPDAAYSLNASSNKIIWRLDLCIDIAKWPDWNERRLLRVLPGVETPTGTLTTNRQGLAEPEYDPDELVHVRGESPKRPPALADPSPSEPPAEVTMERAPTVTADWGDMPELPSLTEPDAMTDAAPVAGAVAPVPTDDDVQDVPDTVAAVPNHDTVQEAPDPDDVQTVPTLGFDAGDALNALDMPEDPRTDGADAPELGDLVTDTLRSAASILGMDESAGSATVVGADEPADASVPPTQPSPAGGEGSEEGSAGSGLLEAIKQITGADRFSGARDKLIETLTGQTMPVSIKVDKTEWTTSMSSGDEYRSGRTVVGQLPDGREVALRLKNTATDIAESLSAGDTLSIVGQIVEWNSLYDRPEIEALEIVSGM